MNCDNLYIAKALTYTKPHRPIATSLGDHREGGTRIGTVHDAAQKQIFRTQPGFHRTEQ